MIGAKPGTQRPAVCVRLGSGQMDWTPKPVITTMDRLTEPRLILLDTDSDPGIVVTTSISGQRPMRR